jgi:hypothetical protein
MGTPRRQLPKKIDFKFHETTNEKWYFINGICTTESILKMNCDYLSKIFQANVVGIYNPTSGIVNDLAECISERTFDIGDSICKFVSDEIEKALKTSSKVRVIAHSQGGIIIDNTIRYLKFKSVFLKNLEVFTFASSSDGTTESNELFQEHFANEEDYVARIGLEASEYQPENLYIRKGGKGHLLNKNYLTAFLRGDICKGKSVLYKLIKSE